MKYLLLLSVVLPASTFNLGTGRLSTRVGQSALFQTPPPASSDIQEIQGIGSSTSQTYLDGTESTGALLHESSTGNFVTVASSTDTQDSTTGIKSARPTLDVRIDDKWYNLNGWRKKHPSGSHWIDLYDGRDATEVMHAFHSDKARAMFPRMPKSADPETLDKNVAAVTTTTRNFRALRAKLEQDGWFKRELSHEYKLLGMWGTLFCAGLFLAKKMPIIATVLLSLANTAAGWIGHDYVHGKELLKEL